MIISSSGEKFAYQRIADAIEAMCRYGDIEVGGKLPSARVLASRFDCNYHTVRRGLKQLAEFGLLESRPGAGFFVRNGSRTIPEAPRNDSEQTIAAICRPPRTNNDMRCISAIHEQCDANGLHFELHTVSNFSNSQRLFDRIVSRGCRALLLPMLRMDDGLPGIREAIVRCPVPVVVGSSLPGLEDYCYESPEIYGLSVYLAIATEFRYFRRLGYENIAMLVAGHHSIHMLEEVLRAYADECGENGVRFLFETCGDVPGTLDRVVGRWSRFRGNLAVIVYGEEVAIRLAVAAKGKGLRIPEDLALTSWGNTELSEEFDPPLTSMSFPFDYLARALLKQALLQNGARSHMREPIRHELVIRSSCGGIARASERKVQQYLSEIGMEIQTEVLPRLIAERKEMVLP